MQIEATSERLPRSVNLLDRLVATLFLFAMIFIALGAKSAIVILPLVSAAMIWRHQYVFKAVFTSTLLAGFRWPVVPCWTAFGLLACASALWSFAPAASLEVGATFIALVWAAATLTALCARMPPSAAVLIGKWAAIGLIIGTWIMIVNTLFNNALFIWLMQQVAIFGVPSMVTLEGGHIVSIDPDFLNWSVAGLNILLWPMLLNVHSEPDRRLRIGLGLGCFVSVVSITLTSVHQTSILAIACGCVAFVIARINIRAAIIGLIVGHIAALLLIVPFVTYAHSTLQLHRAEWVPWNMQARFVIWNYTAEHVRDAPFLGIGANATRHWVRPAAEPQPKTDHHQQPSVSSHAHSYYLQVWFELGLAGAVLWAAAGMALISSIKRLHLEAQPFGVAFATVAMTMCSSTWNFWHLWLLACVGIGVGLLALGNTLVGSVGGTHPQFAQVAFPDSLRSARFFSRTMSTLRSSWSNRSARVALNSHSRGRVLNCVL